jgi:hypothetical protein
VDLLLLLFDDLIEHCHQQRFFAGEMAIESRPGESERLAQIVDRHRVVAPCGEEPCRGCGQFLATD